jgi:hypothetical protein
MVSGQSQNDALARGQELRRRGESARRTDGAMARLCYEEAVVLFRETDEPLVLAHTIRHLGTSILSRDAQIWLSLATTRHLDSIGVMRTNRRWIWRTPFAVSRFFAGNKRKCCGKRCEVFTPGLSIEAGIKESAARVEALSTL